MQSVVSLVESLLPVLVEVLPRVARISAFIAVGVFLANVAVGFGLVERIAVLSQYLTRPANLPDEVGTAILTTAASTTAGYGILADFRESGRLSDGETLVAVTMNTFFGFVQHIFTFYAPVLIPILGVEVGLLYVGSRAAIALCITLVGVLAGALLLDSGSNDTGPTEPTGHTRPTETDESGDSVSARRSETDGDGGDDEDGDDEDGDDEDGDDEDGDDETTLDILRTAAEQTWSKLQRIVPRLAIVYVLVTLVVETTDLAAVTQAATPLTSLLGLPGAAVPVVVAFTFDTTVGAATVAPQVGPVFTPRQAVATMLVGGIVSFTVSTFKRSIPFQYGIWGPSFGSKVVAVNTGLKVVFIAIAVAILLVP